MRTKFTSLAGAVCLCFLPGACKQAPGAAAAEIEKASDDQKALYAMGRMIGGNVVRLKLTDSDLVFVYAGLADAAQERPVPASVDMTKAGQRLASIEHDRLSAAAAPEKEASRAWADKQAQEKGAQRLPSGLVFHSLQEGQGASPTPEDTVAVNYAGSLRDGKEFDSSYKPRPGQPVAQPVNFKLKQVVPCWTEALQLMKVGGKAHIVCPSDLAYGDAGRPPTIPGGAALAFEVELLAIAPRAGAAPASAPASRKPPAAPSGK